MFKATLQSRSYTTISVLPVNSMLIGLMPIPPLNVAEVVHISEMNTDRRRYWDISQTKGRFRRLVSAFHCAIATRLPDISTISPKVSEIEWEYESIACNLESMNKNYG